MKTNKYIDSRLVVTRGESGEVGIKGVRFLVTEGNLTLFDEHVMKFFIYIYMTPC